MKMPKATKIREESINLAAIHSEEAKVAMGLHLVKEHPWTF
jgi:hypothetical protein